MSAPSAPVEDPQRTALIRARDPEILQSIVREHLPMLLRAARATGLPSDRAEDAVQETLLTFVTRAHEFDGRAKVRTWLYGILLKKQARAFESARRVQETEEIDELMEARFDETGRWSRPPRGPDAGADAERIRAWLAECLEGLPDRRRVAFVLREVEELPTDEVCKVLEVTPNNLGVLLFRARNGLRECLELKGVRGRDDAEL
ncbi:MAG: sigma-70 family RNA polymerase sigma factor [Gemmatimonadetes bacterium]|nr:sigma-70 family RNA polymerase sigma factor [Gemmatimonadota bacterium]